MKLYLARHGLALEAHVNSQRPLSEQGEIEIKRLAAFLNLSGIRVAHVYHSKQLRARQTAALLAATMAPGQKMAVLDNMESDSDPELFYKQIYDWTEDTLLVSHMPFLGNLLSPWLVKGWRDMPIVEWPPGGMICVEPGRRWLIKWMLTPDIIPNGK